VINPDLQDPSSVPIRLMRMRAPWLQSYVLGIGLASLFSDWSHEIATTLLPTFLATMGVAAAWLGPHRRRLGWRIEPRQDDFRLLHRPAAKAQADCGCGYLITAVGTAAFGIASNAWHGPVSPWRLPGLDVAVRTPVRKALLQAAVTKETYGRAFGFEADDDTLGAIGGR